MKHRILQLLPLLGLCTIASSCNIRDARSHNEYIKSINAPNYINSSIINKNEFITNDHQALLSSPLIRWKRYGKPVFDKLNKKFMSVTNKYLEFNLAKKITITLENNKVIDYFNDDVAMHNKLSDTGVVRVYTKEANNINSIQFIEDLKNAKKVEFTLKDNVFYSDKNGHKTDIKIKKNDFWNSYIYQNNLKQLNSILNEYNLKPIKPNEPLIFEADNSNNKKMHQFVTKFITNNLLFTPLYSSKPDEKNMLFSSPYVLNQYSIDKAIYLKNNNYVLNSFSQNDRNLKKITLKFNPVPIDEATYRLQIFNAFRQNLVSEADYNLFNNSQKEDIDNYSKIYGLSFAFTKSSNENSNKYFYNLNLANPENKRFNDAFSQFIFKAKKNQLKPANAQYLYSKEAMTFLNAVNNIMNQYVATKLLGHETYWNSYMPQSMYFDTNSNESEKLFSNIDDINRIEMHYFDGNNYEFNKHIIEFKDFNIKNSSLKSQAYKDNKILDISKQLETDKHGFYKDLINKLLDDFYQKNLEFKNQKIEWTIPVFHKKNIYIHQFYDYLISAIKKMDDRLAPNVEYVSNHNSNDYIYSFNSYNLVNNSFSENLFALLDLNFNSLLMNIAFLINEYEDKSQKPLFYSQIEKLYELLKTLISGNWKTQTTDLIKIKSQNILKDLLLMNNKEYKNFKNNFITEINKKYKTKNDQFILLRAIDNLLMIKQNESNYLFVNDYEKIIVQPFYLKPLNDDGFTYYQDILVF
ncbi:OppA family ABC transporter substrate-binding lipoprotein [Mycoplasmopsis primatum]|uniref:OppA family ABC transporter substrate-binding lipoprotein n=1 Tax=Mycoplasmopsis primatum TaxID=55604 RepID=UPI0004985DBC|nr:hypothetical protein [Mycoplasmopsis primatum]